MDILELFKGIAVIIDDEVNNPSVKELQNILTQIESKEIPLLKYDSIPSSEKSSYFKNLSFVVLDWKLIQTEPLTEENELGLKLPDTLQEYNAEDNINFIKKLTATCFCPIFIFTNEEPNDVITLLETEGLYKKNSPCHIFVKRKTELTGKTKLFKHIEKWVKSNPSIYVLKEWEREYQKTKNKLFSELQDMSPVWPRIMWKTFDADGANKSFELGELISRNLHTRMTPFEFDASILNKKRKNPEDKELRRVLEGERYLKNINLHPDHISTGDIFKEAYTENGENKIRYFLNIRAQCNLMRGSNINEIELYCLKGRIIEESKINIKQGGVQFSFGQFIEKIDHGIIPFIDDGKIIEFMFRDLKIKKWKDLKNIRCGQLLPPYITRIQQRYALYLQRQGLPSIPERAIIS
ncbi:hypothetical protein ACH50O_00700 [Methylomonas sp. 2BW1-5-20]|uniref:hypothetical protein n=1 Tax=Methylomonas sp. 2BW1-5-20 TaxID=3376686 RepID=UPI00404D2CB8